MSDATYENGDWRSNPSNVARKSVADTLRNRSALSQTEENRLGVFFYAVT